ncbi:MAG: DnaJ domain-containing protein [Microscillaceae bacterium]|jgi:curved DNA-binding protein CbpA|nr:DnaJ domain-containing protein [Microscillaceae bacterium]
MLDYYEILEIDKKATKDQIKAAYKRLALKYHPDRNLDNPYAEDVFKRVNEAYQVLSDDLKRSYYDLKFSSPYIPDNQPVTNNAYTYATYTPPPPSQPYENSYDPKLYVSKKLRQRIQIGTIVGLVVLVFGGIWLNYYMNNQTAFAYYREAVSLYKQSQKHAAIIRCGNAIHYKRDLYEAFLLRAKINEELGNHFKAMDDYSHVISQQDAPSANLYFVRGKVNLKRYAYPEALTDFDQAIRLDARQADYFYYRALTKAEADHQKFSSTDICQDLQKARTLGNQMQNPNLKKLCE